MGPSKYFEDLTVKIFSQTQFSNVMFSFGKFDYLEQGIKKVRFQDINKTLTLQQNLSIRQTEQIDIIQSKI